MKENDVHLKIQALIDNELPEEEIEPLVQELEGSYEYRKEYVELKRLQKRMAGARAPEPHAEWFEALSKKTFRSVTSVAGKVFFIGSYALLLVYALYQLFRDASEDLAIKLLVAGIVAGFLILLGVAIADRIRESKTDRYKGVMK